MKIAKLARIGLFSLVGCLLAGFLGLVAAYLLVSASLPRVDSLADYRPPVITRILGDDGTVVAEFFRERRIVVSVDRMPEQLIRAFVAAEDSNFFDHQGIDFKSIARAALKNLRAGGIVQGGSTITQQVAKSLLLTPERKFSRKFKEAILAFRMVLAEHENDVDAQQGLGLSLIRLNRYDDARDVLLSAMANNPYRPKIYNGLGVIGDLQHFYTEAQWFYARALELEPDSAATLTNLAYSYYLECQWDQAAKLYAHILERYPSHEQAALNFGLLHARRGQLYDAINAFERVLPKPQAYNELGYILMLDKKYTMAEQLFHNAISASPSYFEKAYKNLEKLKELRGQSKTMNSTG